MKVAEVLLVIQLDAGAVVEVCQVLVLHVARWRLLAVQGLEFVFEFGAASFLERMVLALHAVVVRLKL